MTKAIVRFANGAHMLANPWLRRPAIVLAVIGLALLTIGFWLLLPLISVLLPIGAGAVAFLKGVAEIPSMTIAQAREDIDDWRRNLAGAHRIWRAQKEDAEILHKPTSRPTTNEGERG